MPDTVEPNILIEAAAEVIQDELSISRQAQFDQFLNLKLCTSTLNLIDFHTNETLPEPLPLLSFNPKALAQGRGGQRDRKHTHTHRKTDGSAEGCDISRRRQSKVLKVLPSLNYSVHRSINEESKSNL